MAAGALMPAAEIVASDQDAFVGGHRGNEATAYLAAWAVAFDLAVLHPVLTPEKIVALSASAHRDPIPAFEALVGMPIDHYDRMWRQRILDLKPRGITQPAPSVQSPVQSRAGHTQGDRHR
jgi:hypothetical protein